MITVTVTRENGNPVGFRVSGHANMGEYGEDLVCAAVSAIVFNTMIAGLTSLRKAYPKSLKFSYREV